RKEVRAETKALKKANAQHRADIAALKRRLVELERALARQGKVAGKGAPSAEGDADADADAPNLRFRVAGFANLRKKLGLSAAEMGQLLGVSAQSVYHWETGKTRPRASQLAAISAVRRLGKREVAARLAAP
ncbi:MAG: helix-turn-helix transcriptional regulator, partial [Betaproteobacteria bacterium]|nr:helix-turn-helix transcriptional regulator [Betaproteobacteria bacterium]